MGVGVDVIVLGGVSSEALRMQEGAVQKSLSSFCLLDWRSRSQFDRTTEGPLIGL
jgi:hypothetical protein